MLSRWIFTDVKYALRSGVTLLLLGIFFFLTLSGIYFGRLKLDEIQMVDRGNDKVVKVTNNGSFTGRLEIVLDRNLRSTPADADGRARFLAAYLVKFWLWGGIVLVLIYGYYFLTREQENNLLISLIAGPASFKNYYWVKILSGGLYWGIFLCCYGCVVGGGAYIFLKVNGVFLLTLLFGLLLFWGYLCILWLLYLLVNLAPGVGRKVGAFYLALALILIVFLPFLTQIWVYANKPVLPHIPQISKSSSILAFVPERRRTEEENRQIESDLWSLTVYREELVSYLCTGIQLEERVAYFSPVLVVGRVLKALFRPETLFCREFMLGGPVKVTLPELLIKQAGYLLYLGTISLIFLFLPVLLLKKLEPPE